MARPYKPRKNRKMSDDQVIRLNNLGMSLSTIAEILGVHATAITARLKRLNLVPMDTRRAFMETVYNDLSEAEQSWVAEQVGLDKNIRDLIVGMIRTAYEKDTAS